MNILVCVTADQIGPLPLKCSLGADFAAGRHGALTINDYGHEEEGERHPFAYLPSGIGVLIPEARALLSAWLAGDRQVWSEAQTAEFLTSIRADREAVGQ